ncbi:hypothetical protein HAX54_000451 [Datura stramonium]|uniref:Uncharacterized protein n=1 Tax=Datura stramonium TaxID=4076 RepID=A0ABS8T132_DATST|nr:hypothetical protein [Datura stramonium]
MTNREEEEATFQGDNHGIEPQRKFKSSRRDKSRGVDPPRHRSSRADEVKNNILSSRAPEGLDEPRVEAHGGFGPSCRGKGQCPTAGAAKINEARRTKASPLHLGHDGKGDRNRSSHFRKDYEERKKGGNHRG